MSDKIRASMGFISHSWRIRVAELLRDAVGGEDRDERALALLVSSPVVVLWVHDEPVAAAVVQQAEGGLVLRAIAVDPRQQRLGLGRLLLDEVAACAGGLSIEAETDADSVGFYRHCGFAIKSLGEKHPGVERFACRRLPHSFAVDTSLMGKA